MYWLRSHFEFEKGKGAENRARMKQLVDGGMVPGLIGYENGTPVAWCALGPRERYVRLKNSRILKPVDDLPVWSLVCLFVAKSWRSKGISLQMIEAAVEYAREQGATILEAYPHDLQADEKLPGAFVWTGIASTFRKAGFKEVARRSPKRPVMRYIYW